MSRSRVAWSVSRPIWLGLFTLLFLLGGFGGWSVLTTLSGAVVASGQIEVERNRQAIQHPDGGRVAELLVDEGQRVDAAEVLVRLDPAALETELAIVRAQLAEVQARRARLEAERDDGDTIVFPDNLLAFGRNDTEVADLLRGQENLFDARLDTLSREVEQRRGQITQVEAQIRALQSQQDALDAQVLLVEEELARRQLLLDSGSGTREPVVRLQQELVQLQGSLGEVSASRAEAVERVIENELAILQLTTARREQAITEPRV